jgi:orotate phosphoribosyltransferase
MCPTVPGTTAGAVAASGVPAFCAVPAGGLAVADGVEDKFWLGAIAGACAAAGVSPAAAKAITHPISLINLPCRDGTADAEAPRLRGSIGAAFQSLKRHLAHPSKRPNGGHAMLSDEDILAEFRAAGALLEGHFILSSGLRSPRYLQCARVLMDGARAERLARALAAKVPAELRTRIDAVVSPAMGGVIIGHETGRALGKPAMFVERPQGAFELRRGFRLDPGTRVLMVEDVVTTGLSSREAIEAVRAAGGDVVAEAALVDRSSGTVDLGVPFYPLIRIDVPTYRADAVPPELAAIPAIKPGSRATA